MRSVSSRWPSSVTSIWKSYLEEEPAELLKPYWLGLEVKVPYRDGRQLKVARGTLVSVAGDFVKIDGRLGIIIIHTRNIEKMSRLSEHEHNERR